MARRERVLWRGCSRSGSRRYVSVDATRAKMRGHTLVLRTWKAIANRSLPLSTDAEARREPIVRRRGWFDALPPGVGCADVVPFCGRARPWSGCFYLARRTRATRPGLGREASCVADERARRKRARSVADAAPNVRRSAGPSDPIVSSTGMPVTCASGIIGRSPWCSRRPGGVPRGRARDRWGGCGSRRRSRGRPACHRRASS
jgi:hypothetical protein